MGLGLLSLASQAGSEGQQPNPWLECETYTTASLWSTPTDNPKRKQPNVSRLRNTFDPRKGHQFTTKGLSSVKTGYCSWVKNVM